MFESIRSWWSSSSVPVPPKYDPTNPKMNPLNPEGLKPCCACPQTKSARDDCFLKYGSEADEKCRELVQNHIACMQSLGFKI
ncbi:hypothetical protein VKT23_017202 [Stygiomarasmius scandens]|uniref:Cytochrome c oxidase copper chaperone n=1 Tax=Marasmiellus scandens TaxID=2682957 RepID=A0ABR1IVW2_9AGAR